MFGAFRAGFGGGVLLCLTGALVACGSSDNGSPHATGGAAGTGGGAGASAGNSSAGGASGSSEGGGSSDGGAGGGAAGGASGSSAGGALNHGGGAAGSAAGGAGGSTQIPAFVSNPTQTLVTHTSTGGSDIVLLSSQVRQTTGTLNYVDWFGEVLNNSNATRCFIELVADFQNGSNASVEQITTYVYTAPYKVTGSTLSASCLAPGEKGVVWGNDLPNEPINLAAIKILSLTISSLEENSAVPHPLAPKVGTLNKKLDSLGMDWTVSGSATAASSAIYNLSLSFWGKSGDFYVDTQKVYHLDDFLPGDVWAFDTAPLGLAATTLDGLVYTSDFIEGNKPAAQVAGGTTPTSPLAAAASLARGVQEAALARRARWLAP